MKVELKDNISNGTSLKGYITTSYDNLVKKLGKANCATDGYKTDAEWSGYINNKVFTIYNYKDGKNYLGKEGLDVEDITDWHIGGQDEKAVRLVDDLCKAQENATKTEDFCPVCGSLYIIRCRCPRADSECNNGHKWHICVKCEKISI